MAVAAAAMMSASGCGPADALDDGTPALGISEQEVQGPRTDLRPETMMFVPGNGGVCSATLVAPGYFITAAHCVDYMYTLDKGALLIPDSATVDVVIPFAGGNEDHDVDVALGRLKTMLPQNRGAAVADFGSASEWATEVGYGPLADGSEAGRKHYAEAAFNNFHNAWKGDSGGSVFRGSIGDDGPLLGVISARQNSGADVFANPIPYKPLLSSFMRGNDFGFEIGLDRVGGDLRNFSTAGSGGLDLWVCQDACDREAACASFSYLDSAHRCWLKKAVPSASPNPGVISGFGQVLGQFDRPGSDYSHTTGVPNAEACQGACARDSRCKAFTYKNGQCWLKNIVPPVSSTACADCRTGSRRAFEVGFDRPGANLSSLVESDEFACANASAKEWECLAFVYKPSTQTCWLKNGTPAPVVRAGLISGVRGGTDVETERVIVPGGGSGATTGMMGKNHPLVCQAACAASAACKAWTYQPALPDWSTRDANGIVPAPSLVPAQCTLYTVETTAFFARGSMNVSGLKGMEFF